MSTEFLNEQSDEQASEVNRTFTWCWRSCHMAGHEQRGVGGSRNNWTDFSIAKQLFYLYFLAYRKMPMIEMQIQCVPDITLFLRHIAFIIMLHQLKHCVLQCRRFQWSSNRNTGTLSRISNSWHCSLCHFQDVVVLFGAIQNVSALTVTPASLILCQRPHLLAKYLVVFR